MLELELEFPKLEFPKLEFHADFKWKSSLKDSSCYNEIESKRLEMLVS